MQNLDLPKWGIYISYIFDQSFSDWTLSVEKEKNVSGDKNKKFL